MTNLPKHAIFENHFESDLSGLDLLDPGYLELNMYGQTSLPISPNDDVDGTRKIVEGMEDYFLTAPLDLDETFDVQALDRNLAPEIAIKYFNVRSGQDSNRIKPVFEQKPLKVLASHGIDAYFAGLNSPNIPLTEENLDRFPVKNNAETKVEDEPDGLIDSKFFTGAEIIPSVEAIPYLDVAKIAWGGILSNGFIQATTAANELYGVRPAISKDGSLPMNARKLERQSPYLPNVNITITSPEEAADLARLYSDIGIIHNFESDNNRPWFSAYEDDQIYVVVYLATDINDTEKEQSEFLQQMLGDLLTPNREKNLRADGGYSGILKHLILKIGVDAIAQSIYEKNDNHDFGLSKNKDTHNAPGALDKFVINKLLDFTVFSFLDFLDQTKNH